MFRDSADGRSVTQIDAIITALNHTDPVYLYFALFFFAFLENLFPPTPSDLIIAFGGSLAGMGKLSPVVAIVFSTVGSTVGFVVMYYVGFYLGKKLVDAGKPRILPLDKIKLAEKWFGKYGYGLVVANRFLSGTRAIISFFAGLSKLPISITLPLCALSALLWNGLLVYGGSVLGHNWKQLGQYLDIYGTVIALILLLVVLGAIAKYFLGRRHA